LFDVIIAFPSQIYLPVLTLAYCLQHTTKCTDFRCLHKQFILNLANLTNIRTWASVQYSIYQKTFHNLGVSENNGIVNIFL